MLNIPNNLELFSPKRKQLWTDWP